MKKLLLVAIIALSMSACTEDEPKDCDCDRVAYIITPDSHFGMPGGGGFSIPGQFITVNDCTGVQLTKSGSNAKIGECR